MSIKVDRGYFNGLEGALNDIKDKALWPTTYATDHATAAQLHWHSEDVHGYVVEGKIHITDNDGHRHDLQAGDKITIPARTLHAEGEIDAPVALVVGLPVAVPLDQFLFAREPDDL